MRRGKSLAPRLGRIAIAIVALLGALVWGGTASAAENQAGAVYVLTNSATENAVAVFDRSADGSLTPAGTVATGGQGAGSGLGSQGALAMSDDQRWLFAVNAGSDEVSVFRVRDDGLRLTDKVASGGDRPISLTVYDDLLYVLNAGDPGNITGFRLDDGKLKAISGSTQPLSNSGSGAAPGPAQVQFNPDGDLLVVTEKATNLIDTYAVDEHGRAHSPKTYPSAGTTPFGFAFDKRDHLIVSEAFGGAVGASALSSYDVDDSKLEVITASAPTHQTAACWVVVTKHGRYVYTTNAGSNAISAYRIGRDGALSLLGDGNAGATGQSPIDMGLSRNSRYLYALSGGSHSISIFRIKSDGSLTPQGEAGGLPAGAVGVAAS
jgi:6-phosphogluconolactonase (cycloisomerase 2 family)